MRALFLLLLAGAASAQVDFLYGASRLGHVSANAYALDKLPVDTDDHEEDLWHDLWVTGADRWLIRGDGRITRNAQLVDDLAEDDGWRGLLLDDQGDFFALRRDGRVSGPKGVLHDYDPLDFEFLDIVTDGSAVYVLRTNGAVFRVPEPAPLILFDGPPGEFEQFEEDGDGPDTRWLYLAINPVDGRLFGLRSDGTLQSAAIPVDPPKTPDPGTPEADLPYEGDNFLDIDELYTALTFDAAGTWYALRADGQLFDTAHPDPPAFDFPGGPFEGEDQTYRDVLVDDADIFVLRDDGALFRGLDANFEVDLKNSTYIRLALSDTLPNLENVDNKKPTASKTSITAPEGSDISLAINVADPDLPADQLELTVDPETLPAGATFDGVARLITWPAAGPAGTYKIQTFVSDGIAKPVKAVQTIKLQTPDDNPDKNKKPVLATVKGAVALVGLPFSHPYVAFDRDGDPLTLTLNPNKTPPPGVTFDEVGWLIEWPAPLITDKGSNSVPLLLEDGTVSVKVARKVKVVASLLAF